MSKLPVKPVDKILSGSLLAAIAKNIETLGDWRVFQLPIDISYSQTFSTLLEQHEAHSLEKWISLAEDEYLKECQYFEDCLLSPDEYLKECQYFEDCLLSPDLCFIFGPPTLTTLELTKEWLKESGHSNNDHYIYLRNITTLHRKCTGTENKEELDEEKKLLESLESKRLTYAPFYNNKLQQIINKCIKDTAVKVQNSYCTNNRFSSKLSPVEDKKDLSKQNTVNSWFKKIW